MSIDDFNELFDNDAAYFNGYVSNEKLDLDARYFAGDTTPTTCAPWATSLSA